MNVKEKIRTLKIFRVIVQIIFFILMPSLFSQAFAGVKEAVALIGKGENIILSDFVIKLLILCAATIVFGRIFCGFFCSFGAVGDWFYMLSEFIQKKTGRKLPVIPSKWQIHLQKLKYIVLICVIGFCFLGKGEYVTKYSPWTVFSLITSRNIKLGAYITGVVLLLLIVLGMMLKERFFCQFLCPMGAVFAMMPILPSALFNRNRDKCPSKCGLCRKRCPAHLEIDGDTPLSGECICCHACQVTCPRKNIQIGPVKEREMVKE